MDAERALISKCVHGGSIEHLVSRGIDETHFVDQTCKEVFIFCLEHAKKYMTPPSYAAVKGNKAFKDHGFEVVTDSLEYCEDEFVKLVKYRKAIERLRDLGDALDDPVRVENIEAEFLEASRSLTQVIPTVRAMRYSDMINRVELWKEFKKSGALPGIPMGIPTFDALTLGVQKHEFVSIAGWQGTGKSTLLQFIMFNAYLEGHTPMLISLEMEAEALYRKWDVMAVNMEAQAADVMKYHDLKAYTLSDKQLRKWEKIAKKAQSASNDIIVVDQGRITPDRVYAECVRSKPAMVGVDYVSLMEAPARMSGSIWEKVTYLTQNLKQIARTLKIPVFGVAQTNINSADSGAELENIAYSRSIGQDSDIVMGLFQDRVMKENRQMEVRLLKVRDGPTCNVGMLWDPAVMHFREWRTADMFGGPGGNGEVT